MKAIEHKRGVRPGDVVGLALGHPDSALVQEESFGPLVVMMAARDIDHTLELCNSVPHGLVTTLFSNDAVIQQRVTQDAQTGIISINLSPLAIDPAAPFGGWKASGIGLPEHGQWDKAFYTKPQAVYGMQVIPAHLSLLKEE